MNDVVDSHFEAVRDRIVAQYPTRKVVALVDVMDWPPKQVDMEAFYCLLVNVTPLGKQAYSARNQYYVFNLQWVWLISGTEIQVDLRSRSRGDRGRTNRQMQQELAYGLAPFYAVKKHFTAPAGVLIGTPVDPPESITWTMPTFLPRVDDKSGMIYGSAAVYVTGQADSVEDV